MQSALGRIPSTTIGGRTFEFTTLTATLGLLVHIVMMAVLMTAATPIPAQRI